MATFYLDHVGGSDAADGTTFANRWLTFASGATAARTAPGDTIRIMASPNETSLGAATWTQDSKTITLAGALTANISDCETAWTASANVTATATTATYKENTKSANIVIASGFTTGLAAYFATGTLDFSAYQQVSFWIQANAVVAASTLSLRLCSDAAGATTVNTIAIPALPNTFGQWVNVTVNTGAALGASIGSVALYGDLDPGAVTINIDNIIACKAASSADSLTLTSLIGKAHNLSWLASTSYTVGDIRKPTQPNRNGYRYRVTAQVSPSGSTEPIWPQEINGATFTDGGVTWICDNIEDTWYGIQSINGATVKLDNSTSTLGNAGRGYSGATETVTTYKREPIAKMGANGVVSNIQQESGIYPNRYVYSGGWNRTDMSTQTGETWLDLQCGLGTAFAPGASSIYTNLNSVRGSIGIQPQSVDAILNHCHHNNHVTNGVDCATNGGYGSGVGLSCCNNTGTGFRYAPTGYNYPVRSLSSHGNLTNGMNAGGATHSIPHVDIQCKNNGASGVISSSPAAPFRAAGLVTRGNAVNGINTNGDVFLVNSLLTDATPILVPTNFDFAVFSQRDGQTANNHLITWEGGTIISATDQRHTASGISWKFRPTLVLRVANRPLRLSVYKRAVSANSVVTVNIWTRRDNTNINGVLKILGGQIPGVGSDISVVCAPSINTWVQSSNLTFTPTEDGVVEIIFEVYDGVGTTNNFWIDDISITQ
jgi:hypothetical protein